MNSADAPNAGHSAILTRQRTLDEYWTRLQVLREEILEVSSKHCFDDQITKFEAIEENYLEFAARFSDLMSALEPLSKSLNALEKIFDDIKKFVAHSGPTVGSANLHSQSKDLNRLYQQ